jgi:hypothetical protein
MASFPFMSISPPSLSDGAQKGNICKEIDRHHGEKN